VRGQKAKVGDTRVSPNGYHYTRTKDGWELTGRLVGAKKLGRALLPTERVRYEDGNRLNNDPDNVIVYTVRESSNAKKRARLEAKIEELQAQLDELDALESS
jgi:hypothetical protein